MPRLTHMNPSPAKSLFQLSDSLDRRTETPVLRLEPDKPFLREDRANIGPVDEQHPPFAHAHEPSGRRHRPGWRRECERRVATDPQPTLHPSCSTA